MGFASSISGQILIPWRIGSYSDEQRQLFRLSWQEIQRLPKMEDDFWPYLPREIFHCVGPCPPVSLNYRADAIHFGLVLKEISKDPKDWTEWIEKFEDLLRRLYWIHAAVQVFAEAYRLPGADDPEFGRQYVWRAHDVDELAKTPAKPTVSWQRTER